MGAARWALFAVGIATSVALSVLLHGVFLFLFFPLLFLPFGGRRTVARCPACGFETLHPAVRYCPQDGTRLGPRP